jgi:hypothetical protein
VLFTIAVARCAHHNSHPAADRLSRKRRCALDRVARRRGASTFLVPASPAVPAATEKNQHNDEDYKKCRRVHAVLLCEAANLRRLAALVLVIS